MKLPHSSAMHSTSASARVSADVLIKLTVLVLQRTSMIISELASMAAWEAKAHHDSGRWAPLAGLEEHRDVSTLPREDVRC